MLSDRFIRNAKPGMYADEGGLYLQVYATGNKAFVLRTQVGGVQRKKVLGHYPAMGLAAARDAATRSKSGRETKTLQEAFDLYYRFLQKQFRRPEQSKRMIEKDILEPLGSRHLDGIDRADVTAAIQKVVDRGAPVMANRLLIQTKRFLSFCEQHGWLKDNPLQRVTQRAIGGKEAPRERDLSWEEIVDLLAMVQDPSRKFSDGTRWAIIGDLLTGQRATEVLNMVDKGLPWIEGPAKTSPYKVPMTHLVRFWLRRKPEKVPTIHSTVARIFANSNLGYTPHDLRRTFASRLSDLGVMPHVVEKMLAHKMEGVMAVYNRAEFWPDRVAAQKLWDRKLLSLRKKLPRSRNSTGRTRQGKRVRGDETNAV